MRVTNTLLYNNIYANLQNQMEDLFKLNDDLSSGVRIHKPSDDPFNATRSLDLDTSIAENSQFQSNVQNGQSWLGFASESLMHAENMTQTLYTKAVAADNDSLSEKERGTLALQVNDLLEELYNQANDKFNDKYIFNGDATNAPPFLAIRNAEGKIEQVAQFVEFQGGSPDNPIYVYNEDSGAQTFYDKDGNPVAAPASPPAVGESSISGEINRKVGINDYIDISINGANAFQPDGSNAETDIFKAVIELREGLENNDKEMIGGSISKLQNGMEQITNTQSRAGTIYNRLEIEMEMMNTNEINLTEALSNIEDTDVTQAMMEYTRLQATYQMSLQVGAKIMQTSLVSYL